MKKRVLAIILCFLILITTIGCSKNIGKTNKENIETISENNEDIVDKNKGGYVEEVIKISDNIEYIIDVVKLQNGNITVAGADKDFNYKVFISEDDGSSWREREIKHLDFEDDVRSESISLLKNGDILISYIFEEIHGIKVRYGMINEAGEINEIDLGIEQELTAESFNDAPTYFTSLSNGDLIYTEINADEMVQIDGNNLQEKFRYDVGMFFSMAFNLGDKLIITSMDATKEYDMSTGELIKTLESLDEKLNDSDQGGMIIKSESDEELYYYSLNGLYTYDLDKNESKLLVDDSKYMEDPNSSVDKLIELENDSYLTLINNPFTGGNKLIKYSYDPNYVKVDNSDVTVYSLTENEKLRSKIAMYESDNPDIEIKYEVGVSSADGTQISDAIKTLNTEIMAGKGPDIILLDGLPADSFVENKVLADISDIANGNDEEVFEGIVNSYKVDGELYQLPLYIKIPMLIGNKDVISKINDMDSLLSVTKENAKESDGRIFQNLGRPEEFIASLYCIYENNWITDKELNKENLTKFMNGAKEIYNISKEKDDIFFKKQMEEVGIEYGEQAEFITESKMDICPTFSVREVIYSKEKPLLGYGGINNNYDIENIVNMQITETDLDYKVLTKADKNIFVPYENIAINKNTENLELSKDIIKNIIKENASRGNFTIYKTSFINGLQMSRESDYNEANNHYVKYVERDVDENGNKVEYPQYWANEDDINKWVEEIDKLNVEAKVNIPVLKEVATQFKSVIEENLDVKKAVSNVVKNLEIYLAE